MNQDLTLPKISIIIPTYNASSCIGECLGHIFDSKFKDFEIILVDDCSSDDTLERISGFSCTIIQNEVNKGPAFSRNRGVSKAKGEIILFIDSDILIPPDLLKDIFNFFESNKSVSILQCRYDDLPVFKNLFSQYKHFIFSFRGFSDGNKYVHHTHTACVAMKKAVLNKVQFDESLRRREDIDFGLRCIQNGFLIYAHRELKVTHIKKYDLFSFSKYQFLSAKKIAIQYILAKKQDIKQEFLSVKQPLYKRLWFLRPVLAFLIIINFIWLLIFTAKLSIMCLSLILLLSFLTEIQFCLYLLRVAPVFVSFAARFLYFYDGLLLGLGIISGVTEALYLKFFTRQEIL